VITKRGSVRIENGVVSVSGYELSVLTYPNDKVRSCLVQALQDAELQLRRKLGEVESNAGVITEKLEAGIAFDTISFKGIAVTSSVDAVK